MAMGGGGLCLLVLLERCIDDLINECVAAIQKSGKRSAFKCVDIFMQVRTERRNCLEYSISLFLIHYVTIAVQQLRTRDAKKIAKSQARARRHTT